MGDFKSQGGHVDPPEQSRDGQYVGSDCNVRIVYAWDNMHGAHLNMDPQI